MMIEKTKKIFVDSATMLRFMILEDANLEQKFIYDAKGSYYTTDQELYMAIASILPYDNSNIKKLGKLLEVMEVMSYEQLTGKPKIILSHDAMEKIRQDALR